MHLLRSRDTVLPRTVQAQVKDLDALKPSERREDYGVTGRRGLVVRVWPSGKRVFVHRFKVRNVTFKLTLGTYPQIKLAELLAIHADQRHQLERGENPATQAQREAHARALAPTVNALAQRYLEEHARPRKRTAAIDEATLDRDVLPKWGKLDAREITFQDVDALLAKIKSDPARGKTAPRKVLAVVRKMFSWALSKRILETNPARGVDVGRPPAARTRALSDAELHSFMCALPSLAMADGLKDALRLQILTGTRISEAAGAHAGEFDLAAGEWLIPGDRTKNRIPHCVPLTGAALKIVEPRIAADGYLFPGHRLAKQEPIQGGSVAHALQRVLGDVKDEHGKPIASFTSHDIRRTVETGLARLGVSREIRDRILNHKDSSVGAVHYNRHDYLFEKRAALEAWASKLSQIVSGKKSTVTPLRRRETHK